MILYLTLSSCSCLPIIVFKQFYLAYLQQANAVNVKYSNTLHLRSQRAKSYRPTNKTLAQWFPIFFSSLPTFDETDPQLPTTKLQYFRSLPQLYRSVRCKKKGLYVENIGEEQKKDLHVCR